MSSLKTKCTGFPPIVRQFPSHPTFSLHGRESPSSSFQLHTYNYFLTPKPHHWTLHFQLLALFAFTVVASSFHPITSVLKPFSLSRAYELPPVVDHVCSPVNVESHTGLGSAAKPHD